MNTAPSYFVKEKPRTRRWGWILNQLTRLLLEFLTNLNVLA